MNEYIALLMRLIPVISAALQLLEKIADDADDPETPEEERQRLRQEIKTLRPGIKKMDTRLNNE